jgi:hypothetical protein
MEMASYRNTLEIAHGGKGVPYGGTGPRPDGTENHGFKNLKSDLSLLAEIPELTQDPALYALVSAVNQPDNGLLTVGCASYDVDEPQGHRRTGYVELAFNSKQEIADASHYFPMFFHFSRMLNQGQFDESFGFAWVLEGVTFVHADATGFTATIYLNTGFFGSSDEARACWNRSLDPLTQFLSSIGVQPGDPIYPLEGSGEGGSDPSA